MTALALAAGRGNAPTPLITVLPAAALAAGRSDTSVPTITVTAVALAAGVAPAPVPQITVTAAALAAGVAPAPTPLLTVPVTVALAAGVAPAPTPLITIPVGAALAAGVAPPPVVSTGGTPVTISPAAALAAGRGNVPTPMLALLPAAALAAGRGNTPLPLITVLPAAATGNAPGVVPTPTVTVAPAAARATGGDGPLITNPTLETDASGWFDPPQFAVARSTTQAHGGTASLAATRDLGTGADGNIGFTALAKLPAVNDVLYMEAWFYFSPGYTGGNGGVFLESAGLTTTTLSSQVASSGTTGTWQKAWKIVRIDAISSGASFVLRVGATTTTPAVGEIVYTDDSLVINTSRIATPAITVTALALAAGVAPAPVISKSKTVTVVPALATGRSLTARDTFTRTVAAGTTWGTADVGGTWVAIFTTGGTRYSVNGTQALITHDVLGTFGQDIDLGTPDHGVTLRAAWSAAATGGTLAPAEVCVRLTDNLNFYSIRIDQLSSGATRLRCLKRVANVSTDLATLINLDPSYTLGTFYWVRAEIEGTRLRGKAWLDGNAEPAWMFEVTDTDLTTGNLIAFRSQSSGSGQTALPTVTVDDFRATLGPVPTPTITVTAGAVAAGRGNVPVPIITVTATAALALGVANAPVPPFAADPPVTDATHVIVVQAVTHAVVAGGRARAGGAVNGRAGVQTDNGRTRSPVLTGGTTDA